MESGASGCVRISGWSVRSLGPGLSHSVAQLEGVLREAAPMRRTPKVARAASQDTPFTMQGGMLRLGLVLATVLSANAFVVTPTLRIQSRAAAAAAAVAPCGKFRFANRFSVPTMSAASLAIPANNGKAAPKIMDRLKSVLVVFVVGFAMMLGAPAEADAASKGSTPWQTPCDAMALRTNQLRFCCNQDAAAVVLEAAGSRSPRKITREAWAELPPLPQPQLAWPLHRPLPQ
eukprot:945007-Rhodomonas_salina.1